MLFLGRILNRFSKDVGVIDEILPGAMLDSIQIFLVMFGIIGMVFITTPWMIVPGVIMALVFYYFRIVYLSCAQDIKRLEGAGKYCNETLNIRSYQIANIFLARAPVFSHISATLSGIPTIRSSRATDMVTKDFDLLQNQHTGAWVQYMACSESFGFYLDVMSIIFLSLVTFQFLILNDGELNIQNFNYQFNLIPYIYKTCYKPKIHFLME